MRGRACKAPKSYASWNFRCFRADSTLSKRDSRTAWCMTLGKRSRILATRHQQSDPKWRQVPLISNTDSMTGVLYVGDGAYVSADPLVRMHQLEQYHASLLFLFGIFFWEHAVTFQEELSRWRQLRRGVNVLLNASLLAARYLVYVATITVCIFAWSTVDASQASCQALLSITTTSVALIWLCEAGILWLRVRALYLDFGQRARWISRSLLAYLVVCLGLWIASLSSFRGVQTPAELHQPFFPSCSSSPGSRLRALGYGGAIVYETVVYALTYHALKVSSVQPRNQTMRTLSRSALFAFVMSLASNAACFFTLILSSDLSLFAVPIAVATLFNTMIATRLVFIFHRFRKDLDKDLQSDRDPNLLRGLPSDRGRPGHVDVLSMLQRPKNIFSIPSLKNASNPNDDGDIEQLRTSAMVEHNEALPSRVNSRGTVHKRIPAITLNH